MKIETAKDLEVSKLGFEPAMAIFELTKIFPSEEKYALTSQIRRSSRPVCLNLREAWAKRRYEAHFVSNLTDCDGETVRLIHRSISFTPADTSTQNNMNN